MMIVRLILILILSIQRVSADDNLSEIQQQLTKAEIVFGQFEQQKQLKFLQKPLITKGNFIYQNQRGLLWKTTSPLTSSLLITPKQIYSQQGTQAIPDSFGRLLPALLSADWQQLATDFEIKATQDGQNWQLLLLPKAALLAKAISQILLKGSQTLNSLEITETSGNSSLIRFAEISHPAQLSAEQISEFESLSP